MTDLQPGQLLARGVCRHLQSHGYAVLEEFTPERGLRVDVAAIGRGGEIWVVECKSSRADFMSDNKWQGYLPWCDRFFWAVDADFPLDILPDDYGLIIADPYDADIQRMAPEFKLAAARRKNVTKNFARTAAERLRYYTDPSPTNRLFG